MFLVDLIFVLRDKLLLLTQYTYRKIVIKTHMRNVHIEVLIEICCVVIPVYGTLPAMWYQGLHNIVHKRVSSESSSYVGIRRYIQLGFDGLNVEVQGYFVIVDWKIIGVTLWVVLRSSSSSSCWPLDPLASFFLISLFSSQRA